jgi:hypothetical protein
MTLPTTAPPTTLPCSKAWRNEALLRIGSDGRTGRTPWRAIMTPGRHAPELLAPGKTRRREVIATSGPFLGVRTLPSDRPGKPIPRDRYGLFHPAAEGLCRPQPRGRYGREVLRELQSNQGRNLESHLMQEKLHPQSDGVVERNIKPVEEHLRKVVALLQRLQDTTGLTPPNLELPCDLLFGAPQTRSDLAHRLHDVHQYDRNRLTNCTGFQQGDQVRLYRLTQTPTLRAVTPMCGVVHRYTCTVYRLAARDLQP